MGVHDVERVVGEVEGMDVADPDVDRRDSLPLELDARQARRLVVDLEGDDLAAPVGRGRR